MNICYYLYALTKIERVGEMKRIVGLCFCACSLMLSGIMFIPDEDASWKRNPIEPPRDVVVLYE
jgi:hypothetical protein